MRNGHDSMRERIARFAWADTPLGPRENWPACLRTISAMIIENRFPMTLWWTRDLLHLYNDPYVAVLGSKHPDALGRPAAAVWREIWHILGPQADSVFGGEGATWNEHLFLPMNRKGFAEETYFTFSYSPVHDDESAIAGVLVTCQETTSQVQGERQLRMLRDLGAGVAMTSPEEACRSAAAIVARNDVDLPFALFYLADDEGAQARLVASAGLVDRAGPAAPVHLDLRGGAAAWPLGGPGMVLVDDLASRCGPVPAGPNAMLITRAVVLGLSGAGQSRPYGYLVAGINPLRPFDDSYQELFRLTADQIVTGIASARAYAEERRRAEALAELDRAKTAFFSNVSHEFRTPLTLMLGPLEDALASPERRLEGLEVAIVHRNARRLLRLVNSLLAFSRAEAGRNDAAFEPTDLAATTADLASLFRSAVEKAGLALRVDCPPLPEPVHVDREMWEKVVLNLLSNALKFTLAGEIHVGLRDDGGAAELTVRDTGCGIPAPDLPRMFERFHRVKGATARTHEGTGIGLALVKELVTLHGGTVTVASEQGRGTTFRVRLPYGTAHLPSERLAAARPAVAADSHGFLEEAEQWRQVDAEPVMAAAPSSERVLVVDDNADMRRYLVQLLQPHWRVEAVADGEAALAAVGRELPDLVVTDVMMPRLDGVGLLQRLRAAPETRELPIILLSARAGEEARVGGIEAGADDYVLKPFTARELLARVRTHLALAHVRRQARTEAERLAQTLEQQVAARTAVAERRARQLRELTLQLTEAEERERRRIADLLHDDLQQFLSGARFQISALRETAPVSPAAERYLGIIDQLLEQSLERARVLSHDLSPPILHHSGLTAAVEWLARQMRTNHGIEVAVEHDGLARLDDESLQLFLFRAVQELLFNVVKHARVDRAAVTLRAVDGSVQVSVTDRGPGFDPDDVETPGDGHGFGLFSIRERAATMGGRLDIETSPEQGCRVTLTLPRRPVVVAAPREAAVITEPFATDSGRPARGSATVRILVADDHRVLRQGLMSLLASVPDIEVVGEAANGHDALVMAGELQPDVVLMDVVMPGMDGVEATRAIRAQMPHIQVIGLSMLEEDDVGAQMRGAGAACYLSKAGSSEALVSAIREAAARA